MSRSSGRQASRQAARNDRVVAATKHLGRWNENADGGLGSYEVAKKHDDGHHGSGERIDRGADAPKVQRGMYADALTPARPTRITDATLKYAETELFLLGSSALFTLFCPGRFAWSVCSNPAMKKAESGARF